MKKWLNINSSPAILFLFFLIVVWEVFSRAMAIPEYIMPAPTAIANALFQDWPLLLVHTKTTFLTAIIGLALAIVVALVIAVIMDKVRIFKKIIYPLLIISQTIPIIALAPLMIIWFGYGILPKVLVVTLVCFFPVAVSLVNGLENVDRELLEIMQVMGARPFMVFSTLQFPAVLPYFFSGLKIAATYSVMGAVIGEWLGASSGLGIYMKRTMHSFNTSSNFAAILIVVLLSIFIFKVTELLAWLSMPWNRVKDQKSWEE